jgi:hypothetical protein
MPVAGGKTRRMSAGECGRAVGAVEGGRGVGVFGKDMTAETAMSGEKKAKSPA